MTFPLQLRVGRLSGRGLDRLLLDRCSPSKCENELQRIFHSLILIDQETSGTSLRLLYQARFDSK
jgi:hypothetical protein